MAFNYKLSFGCSSIGGHINEKSSIKLLNFVYKKKIKYYDLAPSYGDGKCHKIFGKFLKNKKRSNIFISSKIGEIENTRIIKYRKFLPNLRFLKIIIKYFWPSLSTTKKIKYDKNNTFNILPNYLKDLNTNYIDCIFLHNMSKIEEIKKFFNFLNIEKKRGRIKYIGISLSLKDKINKRILNKFDIIQLRNSFDSKNYELFLKRYGDLKKKIIFYGLNSTVKDLKNKNIFEKFKLKTGSRNYRLINLLYNIKIKNNSITIINTTKILRINEIFSFIKLIKKDQSILGVVNE